MEETNFITKFSKENKREIIGMLCKQFDLEVRSNSKDNFLITLNQEVLGNLEWHKIFIAFLLKADINKIKEFEDITFGKAFCEINI